MSTSPKALLDRIDDIKDEIRAIRGMRRSKSTATNIQRQRELAALKEELDALEKKKGEQHLALTSHPLYDSQKGCLHLTEDMAKELSVEPLSTGWLRMLNSLLRDGEITLGKANGSKSNGRLQLAEWQVACPSPHGKTTKQVVRECIQAIREGERDLAFSMCGYVDVPPGPDEPEEEGESVEK